MTVWQHRFRFAAAAAILCCATPALPQAARKPATAPVAKPAEPPTLVPKTAFTLECSGTYTSQQNFTWGPRFGKTVKDQHQTFVINPAAMTVETKFAYISEAEPWGVKPMTFKISHITPAGRIVYCSRLDSKPCVKGSNSTEANGRTAFINISQTIIDMVQMNWRTSGMFAVNKDNSTYLDLNSTRGDCKHV